MKKPRIYTAFCKWCIGGRYGKIVQSKIQAVSEDSYLGNTNNPPSLNRYAYVLDNSETYSDPSGHSYTYMSLQTFWSTVFWPEHEWELIIDITALLAAFLGFATGWWITTTAVAAVLNIAIGTNFFIAMKSGNYYRELYAIAAVALNVMALLWASWPACFGSDHS